MTRFPWHFKKNSFGIDDDNSIGLLEMKFKIVEIALTNWDFKSVFQSSGSLCSSKLKSAYSFDLNNLSVNFFLNATVDNFE